MLKCKHCGTERQTLYALQKCEILCFKNLSNGGESLFLPKTVCERCTCTFQPKRLGVKVCKRCKKELNRIPRLKDKGLSTGTAGALGEYVIAARLMLDGWNVFRAMSPNSSADLIAFKSGRCRIIECRVGSLSPEGKIAYSTHTHEGDPTPTEIAVYVYPSEEILFVPLNNDQV